MVSPLIEFRRGASTTWNNPMRQLRTSTPSMLTDNPIANGTVRDRRARIRFYVFFPQLGNALGPRQLFGEAFQALRPARCHACKVCGRMGDHGDSALLQSEFRLVVLLSRAARAPRSRDTHPRK